MNEKSKISPLRILVRQICEKYVEKIGHGKKVLEIGCGNEDYCKLLIENSNSEWIGLDPLKTSIATCRGTVSSIPLPDSSVDYAICSQSIEHWYEYSTTFDDGLSEIYRVLKNKGRLFIDYPLYLHGHPIFFLGQKEKIKAVFKEKYWEINETGKYTPAQPYYTWEGTRKKIAAQKIYENKVKNMNLSSEIEYIFLTKKGNGKYIKSKLTPFKKTAYWWLRIYKELMERL